MINKKVKLALLFIVGAGLLLPGLGFLAIQLVPVEKTNPPVVREPNWNAPQTRALMERACFDCHSHATKWPWYSNVAPVSWVIANEVREGRKELNYSNWRPDEENEAIEAILDGEMPPRQYLLLHPEARLTSAEKQTLITGLRQTFGPTGEGHETSEAEGHDDDD